MTSHIIFHLTGQYTGRRLFSPGSFKSGTTFLKNLPHQLLSPSKFLSLTCSNEKWVSEGWSCAGQGSALEIATVARLVWPDDTLYTFPLANSKFLVLFIYFSVLFIATPLFVFTIITL